eukprot:m.435036 g.435036  ORF g.435036 m.435036 type:complete len:83 (+) comp17800_c0_seq1:70-318(+)
MSKVLRELRVILCQTSPASQGARDFVAKNFAKLSTEGTVPLLVREASGVEAKVLARYGFGREVTVPIDGMSADQVLAKVKEL